MVHTPHPLLTEHGYLIQVILSLHLNIIIINPLTRGDHQHALCLFPLKTSGHFLLTCFLFVTAFLELLHPLHQHFHLARRLRHLNTHIQESRSLHTLCALYGQEFEPCTQFTDPLSEQMNGRLAHIKVSQIIFFEYISISLTCWFPNISSRVPLPLAMSQTQ